MDSWNSPGLVVVTDGLDVLSGVVSEAFFQYGQFAFAAELEDLFGFN